MRIIFTLLLVLSLQFVKAQIVNQTIKFSEEKEAYEKGSKVFTAQKKTFRDSISNESLYYKNFKGYQLSLNPVLDIRYGLQSDEGEDVFGTGLGIDMRLSKNRWNLGATYLHQHARYMNYQADFIELNKVVPSMNMKRGGEKINSDYVSAFLNFKAKNIFDFEIGYGRNFIGDGYRSLLLSDHAKSSPYFKARAQFWNLEYTSMISIHQDIFGVEDFSDMHRRKYAATHFLDWKVSKWFSLGLFETIIWQHQEENFDRGFDVNYLNPVIFFRPVEFSVGSSDNALVGTNLKFTIKQNHQIYFQLVFDEFLLDEIKADIDQWLNPDEDIQSGWWANKYGVQAGWKTFNLFGIEGLRAQLEYNAVRPYTYSHSSSSQAYSNFNLPLAHPLGANFEEVISRFSYQKDRWQFGLQWNYYRRGLSVPMVNQGENLELSNSTRFRDFENEIGQGILQEVNYIDINTSYLLKKEWNTYLSINFIYRNEDRQFIGSSDNQMISISLRTNLYNQYFDL